MNSVDAIYAHLQLCVKEVEWYASRMFNGETQWGGITQRVLVKLDPPSFQPRAHRKRDGAWLSKRSRGRGACYVPCSSDSAVDGAHADGVGHTLVAHSAPHCKRDPITILLLLPCSWIAIGDRPSNCDALPTVRLENIRIDLNRFWWIRIPGGF